MTVHLALVLTVAPCVPDPPRLLHIRRIAPANEEPERSRGDDLEDGGVGQAPERALPTAAPGTDAGMDDPSTDRRVSRSEEDARRRAEPEAPTDAPDAGRIVRTVEPGQVADGARAESRFDRAAVEERRAPVVAPTEGPEARDGAPSVAVRVASGTPAEAERERAAGTTAVEAVERAGQQRAPEDAEAPEAPAALPTGGAQGRAASGATGVPTGQRPDQWEPKVSRVRVVDDGDEGGLAPEVATAGEARAEVSADGSVGEAWSGGQTPAEPRTIPAPEAEGAAVVDEAPANPLEASEADSREGTATDGVADGSVDGAPVPTKRAYATEATSAQTVTDGPVAEEAAVAARATVRGAWLQEVDELVRGRWVEQELPLHLQGIGVRGTTAVRFTIEPSGKTAGLEIVRKSGNEWLDAMALAAIPARVPRMPRELPAEPVVHEITFRYR